MATTTNYGWTTPDDTALVKDGAAAIRTLGSSVDTTTKNLNPETTLADLAYRSSTANVNTRLGIGTTGQVLTVAGGVPSWASLPASTPANSSAKVATSQTTTSTSYTDLTTAGPAVTVTTGTKALVIISASMEIANDKDIRMSFAVSGATTTAATDTYALYNKTIAADGQGVFINASRVTVVTLTSGSNTFTAKYKVQSGTGTFLNREINVIDLGS